MNTFEDFGLHPNILKAVKDAGFKEPSPIQSQSIPIVLNGKDVVAQAQTGTGKTAAFSLPTMSMIDPTKHEVQILVITPTRELATQVSDEMYQLGRFHGVHTVTVYGGSSYSRQIGLIQKGASVVVATPGRMHDLLKNDKLDNFAPSIVILDEADEMLDMGFLEEIEQIFNYLPKERQTLLFSATMPEPIKRLASKILKDPDFISVTPQNNTTNVDIEQLYFVIEEHERDDAVIRLLDSMDPEKSIIFCRTKKEVDRLATRLLSSGYSAKGLHGDMEQHQREEVIKAFRNSDLDTLIATDVAARGLNVKDISHVFNYHIPFDPESYVHRIGRTGRAGQKGTAVTLVTPLEYNSMQRISKIVGSPAELRAVPSLGQLKETTLNRLASMIRQATLDDEILKVVKLLEEEMDLTQIAYKAISLLMKDVDAKGPDVIGVDAKRLESFIRKIIDDKNRRRNDRGGRGSSYGGGRSRSSSGQSRDRSRDGRGRSEGRSSDRSRSSSSTGSRSNSSRDKKPKY